MSDIIDPEALPEVLTVKEAAALLRLAPKTLRNWASAKDGPRGPRPLIKIGNRLRYPRQSIVDFLNSRVRA